MERTQEDFIAKMWNILQFLWLTKSGKSKNQKRTVPSHTKDLPMLQKERLSDEDQGFDKPTWAFLTENPEKYMSTYSGAPCQQAVLISHINPLFTLMPPVCLKTFDTCALNGMFYCIFCLPLSIKSLAFLEQMHVIHQISCWIKFKIIVCVIFDQF